MPSSKNRPRACRICSQLAGVLASIVPAFAAVAEPFVAGTTPDRRPEAAPRISTFKLGPDALRSATKGVEKPHPQSLRFLDNQGAWYTPFDRPGMPGPYDIRGLHAAPIPAAQGAAGSASTKK